jgi:uncharacterized protein (DUF362 family)
MKSEHAKQRKVILRRCADFDPAVIRGIIKESIEELGEKPHGRTLVKPNVVTANKKYIHHSYTHPAFMEGLVEELKQHTPAENITIGESSGFGVPPGLFLSEAGYFELGKKLGVGISDFNQESYQTVELSKGVAHKSVRVAGSLHNADYKVWAPKLKYHICCTITNALKLNIGILLHKERMHCHDDRLNEKIVDLLEVGYPDLIATDAIYIGHGYESAPQGFHLGLIMVANDPVASDAVASAVLGYRPEETEHLKIASERGYGSISLDDIAITGDYPLGELREKTKDIVSEYQDIHEVETPLKFYCGNAPERNAFCYGGCLAAVKGCLGTVDKRRPGSVQNARPGAIVTGVYDGDVIHPGQPVMLLGECTRVTGRLEAGTVKRLPGCPIGTARMIFVLPRMFGMPSPATDLRDALLFARFFARDLWKSFTLKYSLSSSSVSGTSGGSSSVPRTSRSG